MNWIEAHLHYGDKASVIINADNIAYIENVVYDGWDKGSAIHFIGGTDNSIFVSQDANTLLERIMYDVDNDF